MTAHLTVIDGEDKGVVISVQDGQTLVVGRSSKCDAKLYGKGVSRNHCRLVCEGGKLVVVDLDSSNGTFVNDRRVHEAELAGEDTLRLGCLQLTVSLEGPSPAASTPTPEAEPANMLDAFSDVPPPVLPLDAEATDSTIDVMPAGGKPPPADDDAEMDAWLGRLVTAREEPAPADEPPALPSQPADPEPPAVRPQTSVEKNAGFTEQAPQPLPPPLDSDTDAQAPPPLPEPGAPAAGMQGFLDPIAFAAPKPAEPTPAPEPDDEAYELLEPEPPPAGPGQPAPALEEAPDQGFLDLDDMSLDEEDAQQPTPVPGEPEGNDVSPLPEMGDLAFAGEEPVPAPRPVPPPTAVPADPGLASQEQEPEEDVPSALPAEGPAIGSTLGGCELVELVAASPTIFLFRGTQPLLGREVGVHVLTPEIGADPAARGQLMAAARAAGRVNSRHFLHVLDAGTSQEWAYMITEHVQGVTGAEMMEKWGRSGRFDLLKAIELARQAAMGLQASHEAGVLHLSINPANVVIAQDRVAKLTLVARACMEGETPSPKGWELTQGPLHFRAPEDVQGAQALDHRADIYSLGATLFALVAGQPPFADTHQKDLPNRVIRDDPGPPTRHNPGVPQLICQIIAKAMAKSPGGRFETARDMRKAIERAAKTR